MSARKLSRRLAGTALALAAALGGVSMAAAHSAGGPAKTTTTATAAQSMDIVWT